MNRPLLIAPTEGPSSDARATIICLGEASVVLHARNSEPEVVVTSGKPLAVLVYLLHAPNRRAPRDRLVDLLWGSLEPAAARHQLRNALLYVRSRIGTWAVDADDRSCTLSDRIDADVLDFRAAMERGDVAEALRLYKGDFLADFASPGCQEFELWAEPERAHLRYLAAGAAESCCQQALDRGRPAQAREIAKRFRSLDPDSEIAWSLGLEALLAAGDRTNALIEASRFEAWLEAEERDADSSSRTVLRAARQATSDPDNESSAISARIIDLVGRETEFATILDAWKKATKSQTQIVQVTGPAGLGKTRLLEDVANRLRAKRQLVASVRAYPGERDVPYALLATIVNTLAHLPGASGVLGSVVPTLLAIDPRLADQYSGKAETGPGADIINRRSVALRELIAAVAEEASLALFIDDLHWADPASRAVIASALSHVSKQPVLFVLASRGSAVALEGESAVTTVFLAPLSEQNVLSLLASMAAFPIDAEWPQRIVRAVHVAAAGNPLLVLAAVEELKSKEVVSIDNGAWRLRAPEGDVDPIAAINPMEARLRSLAPDAFAMIIACGVSGVPLPREVVLEAVRQTGKEGDDTLLELERLGHVSVSAAGVEVAHDSIAECALALAEASVVSTIQGALGAALVLRRDDAWVIRGIRHLLAADRRDKAFTNLRQLVRRHRVHSNESTRDIVASILGGARDDDIVNAALRSLPLTTRFTKGTAVAASVLLLAAATFAGREITHATEPAVAGATFEIFVREDGVHARHATVTPSEMQRTDGRPIVARMSASTVDTFQRAAYGANVRPGADEWVGTWEAPDTGGTDIALFGPAGFKTRITRSRADEAAGSWAPDGRQLAIETSQFGDSGHRKIAIMNLATRVLRPLDTIHESQSYPRWSPDGTRLMFIRGQPGAAAICVAAVSGMRRFCVSPSSQDFNFLGWTDDRHLLLTVGRARELEELDATTREFRSKGVHAYDAAQLSPNGDWLIYQVRSAGTEDEINVVPTADLSHPRRVILSEPAQSMLDIYWRGRRPFGEYLDSLVIDSHLDTVSLGVPSQLHASGLSQSHRSIPVNALEWASLNPDVATVDAGGVMHATTVGVVTIEASAGGWRIARRSFHVIDPSTSVLLEEDWSHQLAQRWRPFGDPFPHIVYDSLIGMSFFNNGDKNYFSGVYTPDTFDARAGLALDAIVRTRVTQTQWQELQIGLVGGHGVSRLSRSWNHVTGYVPSGAFDGGCLVAYPEGEGPIAAKLMSPAGELPRRPGAGLPDIALGVPTRVRVQILPDGRCGIAVDGVPLYVSIQRVAARIDSMVVLIQGSSVGTKVLVGRLSVRRGVPPDVNWNAVPNIGRE